MVHAGSRDPTNACRFIRRSTPHNFHVPRYVLLCFSVPMGVYRTKFSDSVSSKIKRSLSNVRLEQNALCTSQRKFKNHLPKLGTDVTIPLKWSGKSKSQAAAGRMNAFPMISSMAADNDDTMRTQWRIWYLPAPVEV